MAPIFEDWNNKKDRPREDDLFDRSSLALAAADEYARLAGGREGWGEGSSNNDLTA